jgi:DNA-binding response OmpR family regulator
MEKQIKKILIIDDEPDSLRTLSMALKSEGYNILGAFNGKEGLKIFKEEKPDMVILDIIMPVMDGWEVLQKIKTGFKSKRVPVIIVTAKSEDINKTKGYEYGVDFYATKPYNLKHILSVVNDMLSG